MAGDSEDLVLSISADVRQMQRALARITGDTSRATGAMQKAFDSVGNRSAGVFDKVAANSNRAAAVVENSGRRFAAAMNGSRVQTANLAAQLQDIGVQLQSGTSPLTVALQQGTQIGAAFGSAGAGGAVRALGAAFASVLSPMNLVTIGLIAAGGYAVNYFSEIVSGGEKSEKELKAEADRIDAIVRKWGDAVPALKEYYDQRQRILDAQGLRDVSAARAAEEYDKLEQKLRDIAPEILAVRREFQRLGGDRELIKPLLSALAELDTRTKDNKATGEDVAKVYQALARVFASDLVPDTNNLVGRLGALATAWDESARAAGRYTGQAEKALGAVGPFPARPDLSEVPTVRLPDTVGITPDRRVDPYFDDPASSGKKLGKAAADEFDKLASGGVVGRYVDQVVKAESGGDRFAKNSLSSATGLGQFIKSTWLEQFRKEFPDRAKSMSDATILALRTDADISRQLIEAYAQENAGLLRSAGVAVNEAALHLAHFLGPSGAIAVLTAKAGTPVSQVLGADQIRANPSILGGGATVDDVIAYGNKRAGDTAALAANFQTAAQAAREFDKAEKQALQTAEQLGSAVGNALSGLINAFADGKLEAEELLGIVAQLAQQLLSLNGAGGFGGGFISSILGGVFHEGGVVGSGGRKRSVHPATFIGAPRYHSGGVAGLRPDEVPAILQRGEIVIPRGARMGGGASQSIVINAPINAPGADAAALARVERSVQDLARNVPKMVDQRTDARQTRKTRA